MSAPAPYFSRFELGEASPVGEYIWARDRIQDKPFLARTYADLPSTRQALLGWEGLRHASFLTLLRVEPVTQGWLALFRHLGSLRPLPETDPTKLSADQLCSLAWRWVSAMYFMHQQGFSLPMVSPELAFWDASEGLKILGHELCSAYPGYEPAIDVRYAPPEWRLHHQLNEMSRVYICAAFLVHFFRGAPHREGAQVNVTQSIRRLKKGWDSLLERMLVVDPQNRPGFAQVLDEIRQLSRSSVKDDLKALIAADDTTSVQVMTEIAVQSTKSVFIESAAGLEVVKRLAPFRRTMEARDWLVLQVWAPDRRGIPYRAVNELMEQLDHVLRQLGEQELASQLSALTEWQDATEIMQKWHPLSERLVKVLLSRAFVGVVLIVEDAHHLDQHAVEALVSLAHWVKQEPVMFVVSSDRLICPQVRHMWSHWPASSTVITADNDKLVRSCIWPEETNLSPSSEVALTYQLLETCFGKASLPNYLERSWSYLKPREQLILKTLVCSFRGLTQSDLHEAMDLRELTPHIDLLVKSRILYREDEELGINDVALAGYVSQQISPDEKRFVWSRLLEHERQLPDPDQLQILDLRLNLGDSIQATVECVIQDCIHTYSADKLNNLRRLTSRHKVGLDAIQQTIGVLTGAVCTVGKPPFSWMKHANDAWRHVSQGDARRAAQAWLKVSNSKRAGSCVQAWSLAQAAISAIELNDRLRVASCARSFSELDLSGIPENAVGTWRAWIAEAFLSCGDDHHEWVRETLDDQTEWGMYVRAVADRCANRDIECVSRYRYLANLIEGCVDLRAKARAFHRFGNAFFRADRPSDATRAYQRAITEYTRMKNMKRVKDLKFNLAAAQCLSGQFQRSRVEFQSLLSQTDIEKDPLTRCQILYNLSVIALVQYEFEHYCELAAEHLQLAGKLRDGNELARYHALRIHAAHWLDNHEAELSIRYLSEALAKDQFFPLLQEECAFAVRLGYALVDHVPESTSKGRFTVWRHQLLDGLLGLGQDNWSNFMAGIKDGLYRAYNLLVLRITLERNWLEGADLPRSVADAYDQYARECGLNVGTFIRQAFPHRGVFGEVTTTEWERLIKSVESVNWWQPEPWQSLTGFLNEVRRVWVFDEWGVATQMERGWGPLSGLDEPPNGSEVRRALQMYDKRLRAGHLSSTMHVSGQTRHLIAFPIGIRPKGLGALWFLGTEYPEERYRPLIRFVAKFVEWALDQWHQSLDSGSESERTEALVPDCGMIGQGGSMQEVRHKITLFAPTDLHIHISGESGTGKELAARAVHHLSGRQSRVFRTVNCAQIPQNLIESHLFGHVKGAFTGATTDRAGLLELTDGGTLFLDEIGDIEPRVQSLLLRVIQQGEFSRVGETKVRYTDIRFLTATNKEIKGLIADGLFRSDLYFRMAEEIVQLPPLRHRFEDLHPLAVHFAEKHQPKRVIQFRKSFFDKLREYHWPGNVRELESYIRRVMFTFPNEPIVEENHVVPFLMAGTEDMPHTADQEMSEILYSTRKRVLIERLAKFGGNRTEAARSLGLGRQQVSRLCREMGIK
ncbi:MAG: sigma 54-interacting transcriptional regulator [Acidobacteria bacterium]|nr:sigma 54-interacting transcriptional regulator [Acidobacteriota bacterium]